MELGTGNTPSDLLDSEAQIWNHTLNIINSMSLKCAVEHNIPDIIQQHGRPMTRSELVEALPINKAKGQGVHRVMRVLIHSGFFRVEKIGCKNGDEEDGYVLAPASRLLLKDEPLNKRTLLLSMLDPGNIKAFACLSDWFQNDDRTPFDTAHRKSIWESWGHDKNLNPMFNQSMASDSGLVAEVVIKEFKKLFENLKSLVDVGGGTGYMMKAMANAFPHLHCICFDLPHVVAGLKDTNNLTYVGGDMFKAIPPANAVLLKWVMHDWNDEECVKILKRCKEAIPSKENGGKVIIIDMVVGNKEGDHKSLEAQLLFDINMMSLCTGTERDEKNWEKLCVDAGFSHYDIAHKIGLRSLIQLYP